jgi:caffeoyl-CoA O-methyltransferase
MQVESIDMLPGLYPYLDGLAGVRTDVLAEMEAYAERRRFPIVGALVGRLLQQLAVTSRAQRILEIGSGFGYSAAWFLGAGPDVRVICTDGSPLNRERGLEFLQRLGVADRVDYRLGDALALATQVDGPLDIVFCDIDKRAYPDAFRAMLPKLRQGGLFIADNVLWRGFAWSPPDEAPAFRREMTPGVREFNRLINETPGVLSSIMPLRDGVSITVKL